MNQSPTIYLAIADNHALVLEAMTNLIDQMDGLKVLVTAANGKELIRKIAMSVLQPDICLVDIVMPEMDGYETITFLKKMYPYIKGIALTTINNDYAVLKMFQCGAVGYMLKSISGESFRKAINDVYIKGEYFSDDIGKLTKMSLAKMKEYSRKIFNEQETIFLSLCCSDLTYEQIGTRMNLSKRTAEHYAERIGEKLGLHSRLELALYSLNAGIGKFNRGSFKEQLT